MSIRCCQSSFLTKTIPPYERPCSVGYLSPYSNELSNGRLVPSPLRFLPYRFPVLDSCGMCEFSGSPRRGDGEHFRERIESPRKRLTTRRSGKANRASPMMTITSSCRFQSESAPVHAPRRDRCRREYHQASWRLGCPGLHPYPNPCRVLGPTLREQ
jgi:hypothetical protein